MPTQKRGFFACDFCGLQCDTLEEANEHEISNCPKRPPQHQQPLPQNSNYPPPSHYYPPRAAMGPYTGYPPEMGEYHMYPHGPGSGSEYGKMRVIPVLPPGPIDQANIAPDDAVACQHIELFEATPEHVADHDPARTGGTPVVVKQVGLRCAHCSKNPLSGAGYSTVFPGSLGSLSASVRMVADNHLNSCGMAPEEVRRICDRASKRRVDLSQNGEGRNSEEKRDEEEEEERSRIALLEFCLGMCQQLGIVNKQPPKTGVIFRDNVPEMGYGAPHGAETPAGHRGGPPSNAPYSNERMGPPMSMERMGYPTPGGGGHAPPPHMARHFMMGGPMGGPGDSIAPTPLQRRRDREPGERPPIFSAERDGGSTNGPPSTGYPTPYSHGQQQGGEGYGQETPGVHTPAQPNFEGKGSSYPTPHSAQGSESSPPGYQQYELPSNFPFYQEVDRSWHCKFCSHIHPQYREPQAIWGSSQPPPGNFIDQHLSICRSYLQSVPSPPSMYQGPPPPYGPPYMPPQHMPPPYGPPPGHWEGGSPTHGPGMHPQHLSYGQPPHGEPPYHYPPHMEPPPGYPGRDDGYGDPRRPGMPGGPPPSMPGHPGAMPGRPGALPAAHKENMGDSMRNSISHLVAKENDYYTRDPVAAKIPRLVLDEDKLLLTDYFFFLMKQLRLCRFSEADRKTRGGKREKIKIGYGGLQCIHCADIPNSRKFFWSNVDRLANSFAEIPGHVLKCRRCPQQTKDALLKLKQFHPEQMARLPRGSQKVFFRRMWRRLHDEDPEAEAAAADKSNDENVAPEKSIENSESPKSDDEKVQVKSEPEIEPSESKNDDESLVNLQISTEDAAKALASAAEEPLTPSSKILLAIPEDKEWLSDMDCFIRKQLEVFCATEEDVAIAQSDRKYPIHEGQVGIRCIHCSVAKTGGGATGTGVAFPFAISGIYESVREFQRLHLDSCENLPAATKSKLAAFKGSSSLSSVLRKYYVLAAKALGLEDTRDGMRASGESVPLGSQAAFSFAEGGATGHMAEEMRRSASFTNEAVASAKSPSNQAAASPTTTPDESKKRSEPDSVKEESPPSKVQKTSPKASPKSSPKASPKSSPKTPPKASPTTSPKPSPPSATKASEEVEV